VGEYQKAGVKGGDNKVFNMDDEDF